jgi:hypothetical protein
VVVAVLLICVLVFVFIFAPRMAEMNKRATRFAYGRDPARGVPALTVWVLRAASAGFVLVILVALLR